MAKDKTKIRKIMLFSFIFSKRFSVIVILFFMSAGVSLMAQEPSSVSMKPLDELKEIIIDFDQMRYDSRKEVFSKTLDRINAFNEVPEKDLYIARLNLLYRGEDGENIDKAMSLLSSYLKKNPDSFEAHNVLARGYQAQMSFDIIFNDPSKWKNAEDIKLREKALNSVEKSLVLNDNNAEAYKIKADLSEGEEKLNLLKKAIALNKTDDEAWRNLASELSQKNKYDETIRYLLLWRQNAISNNEVSIEIDLKLASAFRDKKEYQTAINWLEEALPIRTKTGEDGLDKIYSGTHEIYESFADTYLGMKNYTNAESYLKKYLALKPSSSYVRFKLAKMYHDNNDRDKAIVEYSQVLGYQPDDTSSIYNLALLYKDSDKAKSKELFNKYIELEIENDSEYSKEWVNNAKSHLRDMSVYIFPKSKKEVEAEKFQWIKSTFNIGVVLSIIGLVFFLALKYRSAIKGVIIFFMVLGVVIISLVEANSYDPNLGRAILNFIPVMSIGGFLLYALRKR